MVEELLVRDQFGGEGIGSKNVEAFGKFLVDEFERVVWFFCHDQLQHVLVEFLGGLAVPAESIGGGGTDFGMFLFITKDGADEIDLWESPFGRAPVSEEADGAAFFNVGSVFDELGDLWSEVALAVPESPHGAARHLRRGVAEEGDQFLFAQGCVVDLRGIDNLADLPAFGPK